MTSTTAGKMVVVGLGKTGLSCARYLSHAGEDFAVVDSRDNPPALHEFKAEFPDVPLRLGAFDSDQLSAARELIVSPGISLQEPALAAARKRGVPVSGDIDIFSRQVKRPIIAVTGSNGKSTVVSLVGQMARNAHIQVGVGGNLDGAESVPALDFLRQEPRDLYVLELSSFQLETTCQLGAEVAVILNISEDHMDRYTSLQAYQEAKQRIFVGCRQTVVNRDDAGSAPVQDCKGKRWHYGLTQPAANEFGVTQNSSTPYLAFGDEKLMPVAELRLVGGHNVSNALAALALGRAAGIPMPAMLQALREFPGLPHRCQWVRTLRGVDFYDDSKGTNPGATLVAIQSLGEMVNGAIILIAGGDGKGADFSGLHPVVKQYVRTVVLIGRDAHRLADALQGAAEVLFAFDMAEAVQHAWSQARAGDAVLLSPACASLDMFNNFMHRGRVFAEAVEVLQ